VVIRLQRKPTQKQSGVEMGHPSTMEQLGPFDPMAFLRTYTIMMLCFPVEENVDCSKAISILESACQSLTRAIPFLTGQVKYDPDQPGEQFKSGLCHVVPYEHPNGSLLRIKHLSSDFPAYHEISKARAPSAMLDGSLLSPEKGLPDHPTDADTCPVLVIQANFVRGGLFLCFAGMHNIVDGNGLGQIIRMFAISCRGESIFEADIQAAYLDRGKYIPPLKPEETPLEHLDLRIDPKKVKEPEQHSQSPPMLWTYFRFSAPKLANLKADASKECPPDSWITTNDAVSALLWKAITKARSSHLNITDNTTLLRAVNGRRFLRPPIPDAFLGNTVQCASIYLPIKALIEEMSISAITLLIRRVTLQINDFFIRSLATLLRNEPDKRTIGYDVKHPERDFVVSSWADLPVYPEGGFGPLLGMPEFVRRPKLTPCEGLAYLMPKDPHGNIDLAIALRESDLKALETDAEWMNYAEYIG
jgi:hypothetical protein